LLFFSPKVSNLDEPSETSHPHWVRGERNIAFIY